MSVDINLDLDAKAFYAELAQVEMLMRSIGKDLDGIDFGTDIEGISGEIQKLTSELEDAEDRMQRISREMKESADAWDDVDVGGSPQNFNNKRSEDGGPKTGPPNGGTGSSSRGDGRGSNPTAIARRIENRFGMKDGTINADTIRGMTIKEVNSEIADSLFEERGVGYPARNFGAGWNGFDGVDILNSDGRFHSPRDPSAGMLSAKISRGRSGGGRGKNIPMMDMRKNAKMSKVRKRIGNIRRATNKFGSAIARLKPDMTFWYNILAAMIPMLAAFAVHAFGVAAAMGALAVAGAAVVGLGLIGYGEDMDAAWQNATSTLADFKKELFQVFQPSAQPLASISDEFFDFAPEAMRPIAESIAELAVFEDAIFAAFEGGSQFIADFFTTIADYGGIITQLAMRFGGILGTEIIDLFIWLTQEAYANQETLIALSRSAKYVGLAFYEVALMIAKFVATLEPLWVLLYKMSTLLGNKFAAAMIIATALLLGLLFVFAKIAIGAMNLMLALQTLGIVGSASIAGLATSAMTWLGGMQVAIMNTIRSLTALKLALISTGLGVLLVGGGMLLSAAYSSANEFDGPDDGGPSWSGGSGGSGGSGPSPSAGGSAIGGGTTNNYYNYEFNSGGGEMNNDEKQRWQSHLSEMESENKAVNPPSPGNSTSTSTSSSDGGN